MNMNTIKSSVRFGFSIFKKGRSIALLMLILFMHGAVLSSSLKAQSNTDSRFYGTGLAMTSLSNFPIGQNYNRQISIRFKSEYSGTLNSFKLFWIYKNSKGYHSGDGGDIRITLRTDDGSGSHNPSSSALATTTFSPHLPSYNPTKVDVRFKEITFGSRPRLNKGQIYHLHFENVDSNKSYNWISINSVYNHSRDASVLQPTESNMEWALLNKTGTTGRWQVTAGYSPIAALGISTSGGSTNVYQGNGYMEFWGAASNRSRASGASLVRQTLRPDRTMRIGGVSVGAGRYAGSGALKVELTNSGGSVLATASIGAGNYPSATSASSCPSRQSGEKCHVWGYANFSNMPTLSAGQQYYLRLSAPSGTDYRFNFPRDGSIMYGWPKQTVFKDGNAEISSNSGRSWQGVSYWGATNRKDADLEFFLHVK
jgi:hypothetical protein